MEGALYIGQHHIVRGSPLQGDWQRGRHQVEGVHREKMQQKGSQAEQRPLYTPRGVERRPKVAKSNQKQAKVAKQQSKKISKMTCKAFWPTVEDPKCRLMQEWERSQANVSMHICLGSGQIKGDGVAFRPIKPQCRAHSRLAQPLPSSFFVR